MSCSLDEDPYAFATQVKSQMALLEVKSGRSNVVNKDKVIKQKLIQSLPRSSRGKLELYKESNIPISQFLEKFAHERALANAQGAVPLRKVEEKSEPPVDEVTKRLNELEARFRRATSLTSRGRRPPSYKYCPYCRSTRHSILECWRKPAPGACYDCLETNCRRGNPTCAGRINNTR